MKNKHTLETKIQSIEIHSKTLKDVENPKQEFKEDMETSNKNIGYRHLISKLLSFTKSQIILTLSPTDTMF